MTFNAPFGGSLELINRPLTEFVPEEADVK
jgi:hypothetical protein